jgi:hypothetical protein
MAMTAFPLYDFIFDYPKSNPFNHPPSAVGAEGIFTFLSWNITTIDIPQPFPHTNLSCPME